MANEALTDQEKEFRKRARRRLVGAIALVLLMVTVLPMLLDDRSDENAPRPDVTISIPSQDDGDFSSRIVPATPVESVPAPLNEPVNPEPPAEPAASSAPPTPTAPLSTPVEKVVQPAPSPVQEPPKDAEKPVTKPEPVVDTKPEPAPAPTEKLPAKQGGVSVQIGVFTPSPKVEQIQAKVSGLGFNCGTEPITAKNGSKLLRMRCGPFASKDEAQKAQQKLKAAGYNNSILVAHQ